MTPRGASRPQQQTRPQKSSRQRGKPRQDPRAPAIDVHDPDGVRLQKVLAQAGVGSRRACEDLIAAGRVQVDGVTVRELGVRVDAQRQTIHVDGLRVQLDNSLVYLALNKPSGVVSTMNDPQGRPDLGGIVGPREERLFHVGRLDTQTEGLILLTNDGELAHRLAHPSYVGKRLRAGVDLDDGPASVDSFRVVDARPGAALVEVVLHEGRNHIVRRMFDEVGHPVIRLVRTQVGPIRLGDLRPGRARAISGPELGSLLAAVGM
jgi:23S rRNA pseudouridine2605 synthase